SEAPTQISDTEWKDT
nr:VP7=outer capsid protein {A region} [human serotype G4 rotavirus, 1990-S1 Sydney isolate, Peptide Partial, 15 aa] [Rotavirus G4]